MQATLLSLLGLALFGALHGQEEVTVQPDFQQEKVTWPICVCPCPEDWLPSFSFQRQGWIWILIPTSPESRAIQSRGWFRPL